MTEKRQSSTTKLANIDQPDNLQNLSPYASLRARIKARLLAKVQESNIPLAEVQRNIWKELHENVLAEEKIVLSRAERKRLQDELFDELAQEVSRIVVIFSEKEKLTPRLLSVLISPYLVAIEDIQHIIDEIEGRQLQEVKIKVITQNSPITVSLDGVANAANLIRDSIIPWRREHDEIMARLTEQEKVAEIESKKAEILEKRAQSAKGREEVRKLQLENEHLRLQLQREKIELAINMLRQLAPNLSETEKAEYLLKLVSPLETIITNRAEVSLSNTAG